MGNIKYSHILSYILMLLPYPGILNRPIRRNYVDPALATPKSWRDVYHYDNALRLIGWTRHTDGGTGDLTADGTTHFTADGALVFYGCHAPDGRLFEFLDDDLNVITEVTVENLIDDWKAR